ncbi:G2 and S phase-expressed protein 1 isoform X1 [Lissotriton helveticus]
MKMSSVTKSEITLLTDEQFDFDLSLSPSSGKEEAEDDEVFIGPIGHKEKCVSVCVDAQKSKSDENCPLELNEKAMWSPLSGDKFVEIFKEAHLLALQLEQSRETPQNKVTQSAVKNPAIEKFVQESKSKLNIFHNGQENAKTPIPIKRETYCVNDSPFHLLPPSIQQRLEFPVETTCPSPTRSSPSRCKPSPLKAKTPQKTSLLPAEAEAKEKPNEVQSAKRPTAIGEKKLALSKLQSTKAVSNATKKPHLGVPKPKTRLKLSPLKKPTNKADTSEDLHSDKSSVASDVSDSSFNSTLPQNKRALSTTSKFGLKKPPLKCPVPVVPVRKNTSSSSSQSSINSSLNSSLSISPVGLKATSFNTSMGNSRSLSNTSLNSSMNSSRLGCSLGRIPMVRRNSRPTSTLQLNFSDVSKKMYKSNSASKLPDLRINIKPTSLTASHPPTSVSKMKKHTSDSNLQRISLPSKPPSAPKGSTCSKPKAIIAPTPSSQPKLSRPSGASATENQVPKIMQPKRLLIGNSNGSGVVPTTPLRPPSVGTQQNSTYSTRTVSALSSTKRASALPTPFGRQLSGIPSVTPKPLPRSFSSPHLLDPEFTRPSSIKALKNGNEQAVDFQSPVSCHPKSPSSDVEVASPKLVPLTLAFSPDRTETTVATQTDSQKSNEVFLLDIGIDKTTALSLEPEIKPLIDLSNTPISIKRSSSSKSDTLIDLSSPLILLSPDKENQELFSPLVTF